MAYRYRLVVVSPFSQATLTYTGSGTPPSPITLFSGSSTTVTLTTVNKLVLEQVLPESYAGSNLSNVLIVAKNPAGGIIRSWKASATYGIISVQQAQSMIVTIEIRYQSPVPTGYQTFTIIADFNCAGFTVTYDGVAHPVSGHFNSITFTSSGNATISNIISNNTGQVCDNKYARATDTSYNYNTWNLGDDPYIDFVAAGANRTIKIRLYHTIPLFSWTANDDVNIASGKPVSNITAAAWNNLEYLVYELSSFETYTTNEYSLNNVSSGDVMEADAVFNHILLNGFPKLPTAYAELTFRSAVANRGLHTYYFVGSGSLKAAINAEITYINNLTVIG